MAATGSRQEFKRGVPVQWQLQGVGRNLKGGGFCSMAATGGRQEFKRGVSCSMAVCMRVQFAMPLPFLLTGGDHGRLATPIIPK